VQAHGDLALLHHALAVFLAVGGVAATLRGHVHVVQVQVDQALVQVVDAGIAHGGQDAAQVGVAGEEGRLDQRRMGDGVGHLAALGLVRPPSTRTVMNLVAPSPSRTMACASCCATAITRPPAPGRRRWPATVISACPACCVAISTKESLVEVSPSMVMRLKLASAASRTSACSSAAR
jgi:hypothetical protein